MVWEEERNRGGVNERRGRQEGVWQGEIMEVGDIEGRERHGNTQTHTKTRK